MTNTPFSKQCEIITDFAELYVGIDWTQDYFDFYNLGVPWAIGQHYGDLTLNERGIEYVNEAWKGLLKLLGVDEYAEIFSLTNLMEIADEQG